MYAAVSIDDISYLQAYPRKWDALRIKGSYMSWFIINLDEVTPDWPYVQLTEYEAMGWKFYGVNRGYITVYEGSNLFEQIPFEKWVEHPKKNKATGEPILKPMRYMYILTPEDVKQGLAFWNRMEPYVQRTLKSQARCEKSGRLRRFFKRV